MSPLLPLIILFFQFNFLKPCFCLTTKFGNMINFVQMDRVLSFAGMDIPLSSRRFVHHLYHIGFGLQACINEVLLDAVLYFFVVICVIVLYSLLV